MGFLERPSTICLTFSKFYCLCISLSIDLGYAERNHQCVTFSTRKSKFNKLNHLIFSNVETLLYNTEIFIQHFIYYSCVFEV